MTAQQIITPAQFAKLQRQREEEKAKGEKPTLDDRVFEQKEVSAVLQIPYSDILILDDFELQERIGKGSFSEVFRALDPEDRERAIKEFRLATGITSIEDYKNNRDMFQRELNLYRSLSDHPQIPTFHGVAARLTRDTKRFREFQPALVMEYVAGRDLLERLERKDISPEEIRDVLMQVRSPLKALHHGNSQPRYHRDIKPANLKVSPDGTLYLLDFGSIRDEIIETFGGTLQIGSIGYAHSVQLDGEPSFRTDLYSLGRTLYALAIGKDLRKRDKFSRAKLDQTNLDPQLKDAIEMLCDPKLGGVENVADLSDYLDRKPVVLDDVVEVEARPVAKVPERTSDIPDFYDDGSVEQIVHIQRVLGNVIKRNCLQEDELNIKNPFDTTYARLSYGISDLADPDGHHVIIPFVLRYVRERGLTPENIRARNEHEAVLRKQYEAGLKVKLRVKHNKGSKDIDREIERTTSLLEHLSSENPVSFLSINEHDMVLSATSLGREIGGSVVFRLTEQEQEAYSRLPLTSQTVSFLREQTQGYLTQLREGSIDDIADENESKSTLNINLINQKLKDRYSCLKENWAPISLGLSFGIVGNIISFFGGDNGIILSFGSGAAVTGVYLGYIGTTYRIMNKRKINQLEAQLTEAKQLPASEGEQAQVRGRFGRFWDRTIQRDTKSKMYFASVRYLKELAENGGALESVFEKKVAYLEETLRTETYLRKSHFDKDKLTAKFRRNRVIALEEKTLGREGYTHRDLWERLREYRDLSKEEGGEAADLNLYLKRYKMRKIIEGAQDKTAQSKYKIYLNRVKELPFSKEAKQHVSKALKAANRGDKYKVSLETDQIAEEMKSFPEIDSMFTDILRETNPLGN